MDDHLGVLAHLSPKGATANGKTGQARHCQTPPP